MGYDMMCINLNSVPLYRNPVIGTGGITPPSQGVTPPSQGVTPPCHTMAPSPQSVAAPPPDMSGWNPFGEDNFSRLTEEELLDREFDLLRAQKPVARVSSVEVDQPPGGAMLGPPEDVFGSVLFVAPGKS